MAAEHQRQQHRLLHQEIFNEKNRMSLDRFNVFNPHLSHSIRAISSLYEERDITNTVDCHLRTFEKRLPAEGTAETPRRICGTLSPSLRLGFGAGVVFNSPLTEISGKRGVSVAVSCHSSDSRSEFFNSLAQTAASASRDVLHRETTEGCL
jgi:hypothetical protein